eukprot:12399098-Karenia_brevis.AAC.1
MAMMMMMMIFEISVQLASLQKLSLGPLISTFRGRSHFGYEQKSPSCVLMKSDFSTFTGNDEDDGDDDVDDDVDDD